MSKRRITSVGKMKGGSFSPKLYHVDYNCGGEVIKNKTSALRCVKCDLTPVFGPLTVICGSAGKH